MQIAIRAQIVARALGLFHVFVSNAEVAEGEPGDWGHAKAQGSQRGVGWKFHRPPSHRIRPIRHIGPIQRQTPNAPEAYAQSMTLLRRMKRISIVLLCVPALWVAMSLWNRAEERQPTPLPVILQNIQALGELHTTRYAYNNVFEYQSSMEPAGWVETIGMGGVVRSATRNRALVSAHGTVEAGIDLGKAQVRYEGVPGQRVLVVTLPQPKVYAPQVDATVHRARKGMFWRDDNLALKARRDAGNRFALASREQGIVANARQSARDRLEALLDPVVETPIRFEFS